MDIAFSLSGDTLEGGLMWYPVYPADTGRRPETVLEGRVVIMEEQWVVLAGWGSCGSLEVLMTDSLLAECNCLSIVDDELSCPPAHWMAENPLDSPPGLEVTPPVGSIPPSWGRCRVIAASRCRTEPSMSFWLSLSRVWYWVEGESWELEMGE